MILFEFLSACSFIIALKNMVIPAITAEVEIDISIIMLGFVIFVVSATTMHAPPAPHRVLQISPTTSAQKEHTFSEFSQSFTPISAPAFFSLSHSLKVSISAEATAMPSISKTTEIKIKSAIPIDATITPILESIV